MAIRLGGVNSDVSPESLMEAEQALFDQTTDFISANPNEPERLSVMKLYSLIPQYLNSSCDLMNGTLEDPAFSVVSMPMIADLLRLDVYDFDELSDAMIGFRDDFISKLNVERTKLDNPYAGLSVISNVGFIAYSNVLLRPPEMIVPNAKRRLYPSDLGDFGRQAAGDIWRLRHNYVFDLATKGLLTKSEARKAALYADKDGVVDSNKVVQITERSDPHIINVVKLFARVMQANFAKKILPLMYADVNSIEVIKKSMIDKSFAVTEVHPKFKEMMQSFLYIVGSKDSWAHVLNGDQSGGAHHIPSLNSKFCSIVGPVEYIKAGIFDGKDVMVPVARQLLFDKTGKITRDNVTAFFPSDWSHEEVKEAILKPTRLLMLREVKGRTEDIVVSRGIRIRRIYETDPHAGVNQLVTAFPTVSVPTDVAKRLAS